MNLMILILWCSFLPAGQVSTSPSSVGQSVRYAGVVVGVDAAGSRITIKTDTGPQISISYEQATRFLLVPPGTSSLDKATTISASDIAVGDRVVARGRNGADPSSFTATSILVMSKADVAKKHAADRADWERRGIGGVITALNVASQEITINTTMAAAKPILITLAPNARLRRYAPDSVRFSDALPSSLDELRVGDQVRALGSSNEDRSRFTAEELVTGSFRTIVATVIELDADKNRILVTELATNSRVEALITPDSAIRRLSAQIAQQLGMRNQTLESASSKSSREEGARGTTNSVSRESSQQSSRDIQAMIEKSPPLNLPDLKVGEAVVLACTKSANLARVTVITMLAGIEPLLRTSTKGGRTLDLGSWNLDLNMNVAP